MNDQEVIYKQQAEINELTRKIGELALEKNNISRRLEQVSMLIHKTIVVLRTIQDQTNEWTTRQVYFCDEDVKLVKEVVTQVNSYLGEK